MMTFIALFRGINVGGRHPLPMKELAGLLEDMGCQDVRTYIQSGNVVFRTRRSQIAKLRGEIRGAVEAKRGFSPHILVLSLDDYRKAIDANPYPEGDDDPKTLHLYFFESEPAEPDCDRLEALRADSERYELRRRVLYLHAPNGVGKSKLAAGAEKALGVQATARNWRTATKLLALAEEIELS